MSEINGELSRLRGHWIDRQTVVVPAGDLQANWTLQLLYSADAIGDPAAIPLTRVSGLAPAQIQQYPQLANYAAFHLPSTVDAETRKAALKGQVMVAGFDGAWRKYVTGVQIAGVLDDLFQFEGKLGPQFDNDQFDNICVGVWAPTAQSVKLMLYKAQNDSEPADVVAMVEADGVWSAEIENSWLNHYYLFSVKVYVPSLQRVVENMVTDPYSVDLGLNGSKSRFTDLNDSLTKPEHWEEHRSPELKSVNELTIWELHVREFSSNDASVPTAQQGSYLAFTNSDSNGMRHLKRLADAGLKSVHLLPTFHFASVNEDKAQWQTPGDLSAYPPDGTQQQDAVFAVRNQDAHNWGYDPVHFMAPEGSYAVNPDERVKEYRAMVQSLHNAGLRVIQDLVFNHTNANGQAGNSILDKIVPGYYHRMDGDGNVLNDSCCSDTASEHRMMEKLMVDCIVQSARQYKIDGFRFDLMSFHFTYNLLRIQRALGALTLEKDGVDGSKIYLYGEGWTTGATSNNALGPNASQANLYGMGIGTFNDRIRDGVRGGSPFSDQRMQGFATGLHTNSSDYTQQSESQEDQVNALCEQSDWIRAGLAGNMREFTFTDSRGQIRKAGEMGYAGQGVGYTANPAECVNYCSVHDNQNLFDAIQIKARLNETTAMRARRQVLAMSLIALGQGIPFFYSGDEILRSKDMDHNSYNSGDWFNKMDFTYQSNNWGTGLPLASDNHTNWFIMQPLLANPALKPSTADILYTRDAFETLLRIRSSSDLFHMHSFEEVQRNLTFLPTAPGVIAMRLNSNGGNYNGYQQILVVFNATMDAVSVEDSSLRELALGLHPLLHEGSFNGVAAGVPALTTAVFVAS